MTNGRLVAIGAAGIVVFMAVALYAVDRLTGSPAPAGSAAPDAAAAAEPWTPQSAAAAVRPPDNDLPGGLGAVGLTPTVVKDAPPPPPPRGSWEAVAVTSRAASLGKVGVAVGQDLNELHGELSACFDEDAQARNAGSSVAAVGDRSPQADAGVTVLMLQLETMNGAIRIVDAPVEARGGASDGLLACAQSKLRGRVVPYPDARAGDRHRLLHTLMP